MDKINKINAQIKKEMGFFLKKKKKSMSEQNMEEEINTHLNHTYEQEFEITKKMLV